MSTDPSLPGGETEAAAGLRTLERLSLAALEKLGPGAASAPGVDPRGLEIGVVHFGLGAFHRAHQAVFTEDASSLTGDTGWGILGVTGRSARVADALAPQDGLYSVLTKGRASSLRVIGSIRSAVSPGRDTPLVIRTLAAAGTSVASLTITEKGYRRDAAGHLHRSDPDVAADLAALKTEARSGAGAPAEPARTPLGLLTRGLFARYRAHGAPLSVMSCDNLSKNGALTRTLVTEFAAAAGGGFADWVGDAVGFPSTMVDRIVPATTDADRRRAAELLGLWDEGLVVAEPFGQWVLEDAFTAARPAWEQAGATITADVAPFETAKLRLLNGTHSLLAYLGALKGHRTIAEAAADPELADAAAALQGEAMRTLVPPAGLDLAEYAESILARFRNPALGHTTVQVAMDGSEKLPIRALGTAADLLEQGVVPDAVARLVAGWMAYVFLGRDSYGHELPLDDPIAGVLTDTARGPAGGLADRMFGLDTVFPPAVAGHPGFRSAVASHLAELLRESA
ncbi:mannitol dehydrogenase family protein [Arthrobacter jiangjiafuii]|uniref:Mannitol-1-phosphate 5-dehydrogenase n=1 Tax=Arthrobacter jiangjiafuii TaxID=2817475 RepID=A0A975R0K0_9MICC|nr:mannitol dehydrogenase family protein [Arthrobacter jiangjiafuii]MBP3042674.1 mannitol dehydrogenase family protein [Arthrobacter jiangjiafuii]QWC09603.1 mannitol dehydrogenase family protein [Arthrobacter jiangjiafuii]